MWLAFIGNLSFEEGSSLGQIYVFVDVQGHLCNLVLSAIFDAMLLLGRVLPGNPYMRC